MKISELPYYVKFVFMCSDDLCLSTSDVNMLEFIKNADSGNQIYGFEIGDRITFEPDTDKIYKITKISVRQLHDDTDLMRLGVDLEDATSMQGAPKDWLLKILIHADRV